MDKDIEESIASRSNPPAPSSTSTVGVTPDNLLKSPLVGGSLSKIDDDRWIGHAFGALLPRPYTSTWSGTLSQSFIFDITGARTTVEIPIRDIRPDLRLDILSDLEVKSNNELKNKLTSLDELASVQGRSWALNVKARKYWEFKAGLIPVVRADEFTCGMRLSGIFKIRYPNHPYANNPGCRYMLAFIESHAADLEYRLSKTKFTKDTIINMLRDRTTNANNSR